MGAGRDRNLPCPCGSGKKAKRCCVNTTHPSETSTAPLGPRFLNVRQSSPEPNLNLVPSTIAQGYRWRAVFNRLHYRPIEETFHEFLTHVVALTLGEKWVRQQLSTSPANRHIVGVWMNDFTEFRKLREQVHREEIDGHVVFSADAPDSVSNLIQLGYDFFCLQAVDRLPDTLIARLLHMGSFQSARYEVAVAAIMARAGFEIDFLNQVSPGVKNCEFIATSRDHRARLGVEAKCRNRDLQIEPGNYSYDKDYKAIANLVRKAKKQAPDGLPYVTFIDVNLPPTSGFDPHLKPWLPLVDDALRPLGIDSPENPFPFTFLICTNFSGLYGTNQGFNGRGEWGAIAPKFPRVAFPRPEYIHRIWGSVERYTRIPRDV